jgi:hypothetical protein
MPSITRELENGEHNEGVASKAQPATQQQSVLPPVPITPSSPAPGLLSSQTDSYQGLFSKKRKVHGSQVGNSGTISHNAAPSQNNVFAQAHPFAKPNPLVSTNSMFANTNEKGPSGTSDRDIHDKSYAEPLTESL